MKALSLAPGDMIGRMITSGHTALATTATAPMIFGDGGDSRLGVGGVKIDRLTAGSAIAAVRAAATPSSGSPGTPRHWITARARSGSASQPVRT